MGQVPAGFGSVTRVRLPAAFTSCFFHLLAADVTFVVLPSYIIGSEPCAYQTRAAREF